MPNLPFFSYFVFLMAVVFTFVLFLQAANYSKTVGFIALLWLTVQGLLAYYGYYSDISEKPAKFLLGVPPTLVFIIVLFLSKKGKRWISALNLKTLTLLHTVRIPVEIVLYWLFLYEKIPGLMTFEGRNFDILAGLTAPLVYYFGFAKKKIGRKFIAIWNGLGLLLLMNIVINAILSAPLPFQQFAFDQPNIAIFYFPFIWLPTFIVPIVMFSHLVAIQSFFKKEHG
ncbi:hypothetical protein [uncultured Kriegella sp.]|uniref:hypothetical protein n=1 Tax=uncultured Kriegella sp. TaxID=1798910 RepID=UPI0030D8B96F